MDAKFTKGPWAVSEYDEHRGYDCMTGGVRAGPVVLDGADYGQAPCKDIAPEQKERLMADASLIAAAPELYEAARLVMAWHEAEEDHSKEPDFYKRVEMCRESERAIRSAIAKANGDQP